MMVVEPKLVQLVELNEELVNLLSSTGWMVQKPYFFSGMLVQPVKVQPQSFEIQSKGNRGPMVTY